MVLGELLLLVGIIARGRRPGGAFLAVADGEVLAQLDHVLHRLLLRALLGNLGRKLIRIVVVNGVERLLLLHGGAVHARVGLRCRTLLQIIDVFLPIIRFFASHWLMVGDHLGEGRDFPVRVTVFVAVPEVVLLCRSHVCFWNLVNGINHA